MTYKDQIQRPEWQRKRLEIMERDEWKCCLCNDETKQLHVHHLYYDNELKMWEYDNEVMVTVCATCHKNIHKDLNKIFGLIAFEVIKNGRNVNELPKFAMEHKERPSRLPVYGIKPPTTGISIKKTVGYTELQLKVAWSAFAKKKAAVYPNLHATLTVSMPEIIDFENKVIRFKVHSRLQRKEIEDHKSELLAYLESSLTTSGLSLHIESDYL